MVDQNETPQTHIAKPNYDDSTHSAARQEGSGDSSALARMANQGYYDAPSEVDFFGYQADRANGSNRAGAGSYAGRRRPSQRGGRSYEETSGRDVSRQIAHELDTPLAPEDAPRTETMKAVKAELGKVTVFRAQTSGTDARVALAQEVARQQRRK